MTPAPQFPVGSIRRAVAVMGDNWGLAFDPMNAAATRYNEVFRAERHDADVMRRCAITMDRGTVWDPRVWIGVPSTERPA
jgi:hypothetical protein